MSTAASPIRNIKSRLPTSNSISNVSSNGNDCSAHAIYRQKPLSTTNLLQTYSPMNNLNHHLKTRSGLSSNNHRNKLTKSSSIDGSKPKQNSQPSIPANPSPPSRIRFHAIAPAPLLEENNHSTKETHNEQKVCVVFTCFTRVYFLRLKKHNEKKESITSSESLRTLKKHSLVTTDMSRSVINRRVSYLPPLLHSRKIVMINY